MRDYELVLVVSPEGGEEGFPTTVERVHTFIQERGGTISNADAWGRRRLAYQINRYSEGYYNITHFTIDPQEVRSLESNLDLADDVLRHLVVRMDELPPPAPPAPPAAETAAESGEAAATTESPAAEAAETPEAEAAVTPEAEAEEAPAAAEEAPAAEAEDVPAAEAEEKAPEAAAEEAEEPAKEAAEPSETAPEPK